MVIRAKYPNWKDVEEYVFAGTEVLEGTAQAIVTFVTLAEPTVPWPSATISTSERPSRSLRLTGVL
jgi:hypothetical protein